MTFLSESAGGVGDEVAEDGISPTPQHGGLSDKLSVIPRPEVEDDDSAQTRGRLISVWLAVVSSVNNLTRH